MKVNAAYRSFMHENTSIFVTLKGVKFPESAIEFIFKQGYAAKEAEVVNELNIQDKIFEALKLK